MPVARFVPEDRVDRVQTHQPAWQINQVDGYGNMDWNNEGPSAKNKRPAREAASFIRINKQVTDAANNPQQFQACVMKLCMERRPLSMVNVVTILQRAGRHRTKLDSAVVKYLADSCLELQGS